jgi:CubicO group peptidase (beta-lactamase class C family)/protein tyrosine phosphatase (PTP) superfamily phosphohydrolase (DUF442 family)
MKSLIEQIEQTASDTVFSGVISIYKAGEPLYEAAFGYRDCVNQLPNQASTRFGIASGTKFFTALGIGRLVDQGLLKMKTQVGEISPDYNGFIDPSATILHLLTHTSGIYDYYDEEIEQDFDNFFVSIPWYRLETPTDYWPLFQGQQLKFQPGERFSYSNGGYVFLAMLIEKLTGRLFREFMREQVFLPAQMTQTGFFALNNLPPNTALGYLEDRETTNLYNLPIRGGGDGGLFTTAQDLRAFWEHLFNNKILSPALTASFLETRYKFDDKHGYGCGVYKNLDDSRYAIVGGDAGVGFDSRHFVDENITDQHPLESHQRRRGALREVVMEFFDSAPTLTTLQKTSPPDILNLAILNDSLWSAGQPTRAQLADIAAQRIPNLVINLALPTSDNAIPDEADLVRSLGMDYIHIPVVWESPQPEDLLQFMDDMDSRSGSKIFVHCAMNYRASAFIALWRVLRQGWARDDAFAAQEKIWRLEEYPVWGAFVLEALTSNLKRNQSDSNMQRGL